MDISDLFQYSMEHDFVDLQTLIMFLVFEKEVLKMTDKQEELKLYFMEKHNHRMNKELHAYKQKMNISYGKTVFKMIKGHKFVYISAYNFDQAKFIAERINFEYERIKVCEMDLDMDYDGKNTNLNTIIKEVNADVLGGLW